MIYKEGGINNNNNVPSSNQGDFLQERIVVHTMHKGLKKNTAVDSESKNTGIIVMVSGLFLLIIIGTLSYYLVVKKDIFSLNGNNVVVREETPVVFEEEKPIVKVATTTVVKSEEVITASSSVVSNLASSSDLQLASTSASSSDISDGSSTVSTEDISDTGVSVKEAIDTDGDGLSDLEEDIFGTDRNLMDSDDDGYSDFLEVDSLHNPQGLGEIASHTAIVRYINSTHKYSLLYPLTWIINNYDSDDSVMFKIDGLQFVQVMTQESAKNQTLEEWYKGQFSVDLIDDAQRINKSGWNVIKSKDGLNWFLMKDQSPEIFIISYNTGISNVSNYKTIFQMMINSFGIVN